MYIRHVLIGFALAIGFVALLLWQDIAGLRHLIFETKEGWLGGVLLVMANGIVFSGVQFGIAVMNMAEDTNEPPRPRPNALLPTRVPARAHAPANRPDTPHRRS